MDGFDTTNYSKKKSKRKPKPKQTVNGRRVVLGEGYLVHVGTQDNVATITKTRGVMFVQMTDALWLINRIHRVKFNKPLVDSIKMGGKKIRLIAEILPRGRGR